MTASVENNVSGAFSRTAAVAIVLVGVFTFCAFVVLSAYAPALREGDDGGGHALSKSAVGYAFLAALLEETGVAVLAPRGGVPDTRDGALVYTPRNAGAMEALGALDPFQITVVIPPKWITRPDPNRPGWARRVGAAPSSPLLMTMGEQEVSIAFERRTETSDVIVEAADATGALVLRTIPSRNIGAIENLQYIAPDETLEPILTARNGDILFAKVRDLPLYVLSDADLANTQGLANEDRAKVTAIFFDYVRAGGPVVFDLSLHGVERTRNIVRLALEPPFLAATLCALFAILLLALKAAARFGPARAPVRPFEAGKAALADNSAALIRMARREAAFGPRYADMTRRRIAHAIGAPRHMAPEALDALIDKIAAGKTHAPFSTLVREAGLADSVGAFVRAARRLHQFKKEILA